MYYLRVVDKKISIQITYMYFFVQLKPFRVSRKLAFSLEYGFVRARSRAVHQRIPRRAAVPVRYCPSYKKFFERFPKLPRHAAINGEINRITKYDKKVGEQYKNVGHVVV